MDGWMDGWMMRLLQVLRLSDAGFHCACVGYGVMWLYILVKQLYDCWGHLNLLETIQVTLFHRVSAEH
jgi:hypothetical protein